MTHPMRFYQGRYASMWIVCLLGFLLLRIYAWTDQQIDQLWLYHDVLFNALSSDALGAAFVALLFMPTRKPLYIAMVCLVLGYFASANLEQIANNRSNITLDLLYAVEDELLETFGFSGSVLWRAAIIALFLWELYWVGEWLNNIFSYSRYLTLVTLASGLGIIVLAQSNTMSPYDDWVYTNIIAENLVVAKNIMSNELASSHSGRTHIPKGFLPFYSQDLSDHSLLPALSQPRFFLKQWGYDESVEKEEDRLPIQHPNTMIAMLVNPTDLTKRAPLWATGVVPLLPEIVDKETLFPSVVKLKPKNRKGLPLPFTLHYEQKIPALQIRRPNILLITIEDTSNIALDRDLLPLLKNTARQNIYYPHLIYNNDGTINAIYTLLCGDYPYFGTASWTGAQWARDYGTQKNCLPSILSNQNYDTTFMIGDYINSIHTQDLINPMGFKKMLGMYEFTDINRYPGGWGIDDASFFRNVRKQISSEPANKPWFITAMAMGTHVSYNIPEGFANRFKNKHNAAYAYTDNKLNDFIDWLKESNYLKNTIVIITSDESTEHRYGATYGDFSTNHGFMIILEPTHRHFKIEMPFQQSDLQLSLLDYLGINDPKSFGRSFFRMYNSDRDAVFAANYKKHLYWYHAATKDITNCSYVNWQCSLLQPKTQSMINSIFNVDYEAVPDSAENTLFLRSFMEYNDILQIDKAATQKMHAPTLFYLHPNDTQQFEEHE